MLMIFFYFYGTNKRTYCTSLITEVVQRPSAMPDITILIFGKPIPRPIGAPPLCQALCQLQRRHSKRSDNIMRPCSGSGC